MEREGPRRGIPGQSIAMNWKHKALLQRCLSRCPLGFEANYLLQRFVQKSLPLDKSAIRQMAAIAELHLEAFLARCKKTVDQALFLEIGAGVDLMLPLLLYAHGVERQFTLDITPLARRSLINAATVSLCELDIHPRHRPFVTIKLTESLGAALHNCYGINYCAPCDARRTELPAGSIDFIHSTNTMEHIPAADLSLILNECHRLLAPGGIVSLYIDYRDHYSYADRNIGAFNFLRYSESQWSRFNCALQYQNRLRHPQYLRLAEAGGFRVVSERRIYPSEAELQRLYSLDLDPDFCAYDRADLAIVGSHLTLVPK
jgi:SAM-dependent methyltransferase